MRLRSSVSHLLVLCLACALVPENPALAGVGDDQAPQTVIKSEAVLVQIPVVVTDKNGKHIHNLTKSDFSVLEDKQEQKIAVFEEVNASGARPAISSFPPNTFTNLALDPSQRCALVVIVLDAINTNFMDQDSGRRELIKYLSENLDPKQASVLLLMSSKGLKRLSGVTDDPATLVTALRSLKGVVPDSEAFGIPPHAYSSAPEGVSGNLLLRQEIIAEARLRQEQAIDATMQAFLSIAWYLAGVPGRKSLIWATGSFPFFVDASDPGTDNPRLSRLYERAMEALNDAQISVYPVDVRGLVTNSPDSANANLVSRRDTLNAQAAAGRLIDSTLQNLKTFADMTGGRALYNSNDLAAGFQQAIDDASSYYLLGYYLKSRNAKPGWRKLQVKLLHGDAQVRARSGFFAGNATLNPGSVQKADEDFALASPVDSTGVPLLLRWNPLEVVNDKHQKQKEFAMVVPAASVIEESETSRFDIDFVWQASKDGVTVLTDGHSLKGTLNPDSLTKIKRDGVLYKNGFSLKPGDYQVRFVVRNNLNGRIGSVTTPLTVQ